VSGTLPQDGGRATRGLPSERPWEAWIQAHIEHARAQALERPERRCPDVSGRLLAERGFWTLSPGVEAFETEDLQGRMQVLPSAGLRAPGVREALVFAALVSLWAHGSRDSPTVATSVSGIAQQLKLAWSGRTAREIVTSLRILKRTGYRVEVTDAEGRQGWDREFSLLAELETRWEGRPTSPRRQVAAEFHRVVFEHLRERKALRTVDLEALPALGEQRELARRLLLLLEVLPGHRLERDAGRELIHRLVDARLAGSLGSTSPRKKFTADLRRAGEAIVAVAPRYQSIEVADRERRPAPGEASKIIKVVRTRFHRLR
jgi:hypothetical protein